MTCFGIIPLSKRTPSKSFLSIIPFGSKFYKSFLNLVEVKLLSGSPSSSDELETWLSWELSGLIRVRWWKSNAFYGLDKKHRMKSWNAMEFEMIRRMSSYSEYRLLMSMTVFCRLRRSFPRKRQSKKLLQKPILTFWRSITEPINA